MCQMNNNQDLKISDKTKDCIFCKIIRGEISAKKVFENEDFIAFLDLHPLVKGHTLVIPKRHFEKFDDIDIRTLSSYGVIIKRIAQAITKATNTEAYNLIMNNGKISGQEVPHAHFHIIPRSEGDNASKANLTWNPEQTIKYDEGEMEQLVTKIKEFV